MHSVCKNGILIHRILTLVPSDASSFHASPEIICVMLPHAAKACDFKSRRQNVPSFLVLAALQPTELPEVKNLFLGQNRVFDYTKELESDEKAAALLKLLSVQFL